MSQQLTLDLALRPALGREDFFVSTSNAAAVNMVDQWPNWPSYGAIIVGPEGSGKTHLASVWQQRSSAKIIKASDARGELQRDARFRDPPAGPGPLGWAQSRQFRDLCRGRRPWAGSGPGRGPPGLGVSGPGPPASPSPGPDSDSESAAGGAPAAGLLTRSPGHGK